MQRQGIAGRKRWPQVIFYVVWPLSTLVLGWQALHGPRASDLPATLPRLLAGLACTAALLWWLPGPSLDALPSLAGGRRRGLVPAALGLGATLLLAASSLLHGHLLLALSAVAGLTLVGLRARPSRPEVGYAAGLTAVAAVAGLGHGGVSVPPYVWAAMQVPLVLLSLLAGWAILRHTGLLEAGLGRTLLLAEGWRAALRGLALGALLGLPWGLLNVVLGGAREDAWVTAWWQPLVALQPGIAEEAWARVFLISLLYLALRRFGRARAALTAAVLVAGYWFAYLHTSGGIRGLTSTLLFGTFYILPLTYLWLRRGLEPAIGFHIWLDLFRFAADYLIFRGP